MAGRPRTKAKEVKALADQQHAFSEALYNECPKMYLDDAVRADCLASAWREAVQSAVKAMIAVDELTRLLAAKAEAADSRLSDLVS
jgi:hypothetical protein